MNKYTAKYRLTDISISNSGGTPVYMYPLIESLKINESEQFAKKKALQKLAPIVLHNYVIKQEKRKAFRIYFSKNYSMKRRLSLQGLYHFLIIFLPGFELVIQNIRLIFRQAN